ncbi:hypothetical protein YC2023_055588 [Brassica napus]
MKFRRLPGSPDDFPEVQTTSLKSRRLPGSPDDFLEVQTTLSEDFQEVQTTSRRLTVERIDTESSLLTSTELTSRYSRTNQRVDSKNQLVCSNNCIAELVHERKDKIIAMMDQRRSPVRFRGIFIQEIELAEELA